LSIFVSSGWPAFFIAQAGQKSQNIFRRMEGDFDG